MPVLRCPDCGKIISTRFPVHECKPFTEGEFESLVDKTSHALVDAAREQAEISFKAGIREVVDWITNRENYYTNPHLKYDKEWQAKLKSWGIDGCGERLG